MSRKKTISSAAAKDESIAPVSAQPQDGAPAGATGTDATPPAMNGAGGTNTPDAEASASGDTTLSLPEPSQGEAAGAGANAGPDLAAALAATGCASFEDLVDMATVGLSLMDAIAVLTDLEGPLKGWSASEDPAEIVYDLYEMLPAGKAGADVREPRRSFAVLSPVNFNNRRYDVGEAIRLTVAEHAELPDDIVDPIWERGAE